MKKLLLFGVYVLTRLFWLTNLPVFSDEAIYIRWAQVAMREPAKYLFLPMLDGKTPLHAWLLMPFLVLFHDPLFAGRLLSGVAGAITLWLIMKIVRILGGSERDELMAFFIGIFAPFWLIHQRMALAESLLALFFTLGIWSGLSIVKTAKARYACVFTLAVGGALWTKVSALFFIPVFSMLPLLFAEYGKKSMQWKSIAKLYLQKTTGMLCISGFLGGCIFLLLKFSPLFPFLFARSTDYTFSLRDILGGEWKYILFSSTPRTLFWIAWYMTPFLFVLPIIGWKRNRVLFLMALVYLAPLLYGGKVLYSRYFFPMAVIWTLMCVEGFRVSQITQSTKRVGQVLLGGFLLFSSVFAFTFIFRPGATPFAREDQYQYLLSWSAGYGIPEVRDYLKEQKKDKEVVVGTEGYFGTLPDGLLIYFDKSGEAKNIGIQGVGQPIHVIPDVLLAAAKTRDTYLVVNSDRFFVQDVTHFRQVALYHRPHGAPSLLLLRILP